MLGTSLGPALWPVVALAVLGEETVVALAVLGEETVVALAVLGACHRHRSHLQN